MKKNFIFYLMQHIKILFQCESTYKITGIAYTFCIGFQICVLLNYHIKLLDSLYFLYWFSNNMCIIELSVYFTLTHLSSHFKWIHILSAFGQHNAIIPQPSVTFWTVWRQEDQCAVEIMNALSQCIPYIITIIFLGVSPLKVIAISEQQPCTTS